MVYAKDKRTLLLSEIEKKRNAQVASVQFRRNVLEHQRQRTYQHEYERVKGNISQLKIQGLPTHNHKKRLNHLKKVAQASLEGTNTHELYKK
jgi:hypothetical protein